MCAMSLTYSNGNTSKKWGGLERKYASIFHSCQRGNKWNDLGARRPFVVSWTWSDPVGMKMIKVARLNLCPALQTQSTKKANVYLWMQCYSQPFDTSNHVSITFERRSHIWKAWIQHGCWPHSSETFKSLEPQQKLGTCCCCQRPHFQSFGAGENIFSIK